MAEILQGVRHARELVIARDELLKLHIYAPHGARQAISTAENCQTLRLRGYTVMTVDCWIATFCIAEDHQLLHNDRNFDAFESELGLRVVHP